MVGEGWTKKMLDKKIWIQYSITAIRRVSMGLELIQKE
jgi:hypothetical protein